MKEQIKSYPDKIEVSLKTTILDIVKDGDYFLTKLSNVEIVK